MSEEAGERTERASERQMKEVRRKGKLSRSQDVSAWAVIASCAVMVPMVLSGAEDLAVDQMFQITRVANATDPQMALQVLADALSGLGAVVVPMMGVAFLTALAVPWLQGPVHFRSMAPKFDHYNPVAAAKKIFGTQAIWNAAKAFLKASAVGALLYMVIQQVSVALMGAGLQPLVAVTSLASGAALQLLWFSVIAGLVMAAADVMVVAKRNRKQTRVTKQEAKREHKNSEGDPLIKSQRRSRQLAMSRNRMIADVSSASAVVVNPIHVAVALRYTEKDPAPVVVAAGKGEIAARIRARADEANVPLIKSVELAWMMHDHCRVGQPVPPQLYAAVAAVIAATRRIDRRRRNRRIQEVEGLELPQQWRRERPGPDHDKETP